MTANFQKNRLFAKYGHECEMANELDVLPIFVPGNSVWARIRRTIIRIRTVSETSKHSARYFRSQGAIANEKHRHLKDHPHIIHPFSAVRNWWQFFMCTIFLLQFISIPLDVAYFRISSITVYRSKPWKWTRMILDCLCFVDVWLNFATGYYHDQKKKAVLSPVKIAGHYLSTFFVADFISSLPTHIDLIVPMNTGGIIFSILQVTSLLKMLRYVTFVKYLRDFFEIFDVPYALQKTMRVLLTSLLYCHFIACMLIFSYAANRGFFDADYYQITHLRGSNSTTTTTTTLLKSASYSEAFYCAVILSSCAGYGKQPPQILIEFPIKPTWAVEMVYGANFKFHENYLLLKGARNTYLCRNSDQNRSTYTGRIVQVIKAMTSANYKYIEMVRQLREYMSHRQLPVYMQRRLLTYYEFRFQKSYFRESEILATISGQLRQELVMHSCRKLVENVAFFKNLPLTLLVRIVSCLRSEVFLINDVIVRANTPGNCMFFIASGTVAVFTSSGREICHLEDGAHFGEIALVMRDELRVASVIAVEVCELYRLDRKEFVRAIHPYPDLLDNIQRIAADRMERTTMLDEHNRREMASKRLY